MAKGPTGGHTAFIPEKDKTHYSKSDMITRMDMSMGGRAAEEILLGKENITGTRARIGQMSFDDNSMILRTFSATIPEALL